MTDLARLSAREAASRIAAGTLTSEALVQACLARIAEREPQVQAWEHLDPAQALADARARDREPRRGALHGVPVGVKDIMDTADMPTRHGSKAYDDNQPRSDAACVAMARNAGAVILGKTVTTEFAMMSPGKTRNPHNPAHTPGGSSSGSVAAVADGMVPLALGTQTAGSIIRPAAYCGIVGYKPSFGTVAIAGTKLTSSTLDTVGGFARDVADVAYFIAALSDRPGLVPAAAATAPRIGLYRAAPYEKAEPAARTAIEDSAARLADAGAAIAERGAFSGFDGLFEAQLAIMLRECAHNLSWERTSAAERIAPATRRMLEDGAKVTAEAYDRALALSVAARAGLDDFFAGFDAILVPAATGEAPAGFATGDTIFNRAWTLLHVPCITLPAGRGPGGLPVGIQLVGRAGADAQLLAIALFAENALRPSS